MDATDVGAMLLLLREGVDEPRSDAHRFRRSLSQISGYVQDWIFPVTHVSGRFMYFTFAGRTMNEVIAMPTTWESCYQSLFGVLSVQTGLRLTSSCRPRFRSGDSLRDR